MNSTEHLEADMVSVALADPGTPAAVTTTDDRTLPTSPVSAPAVAEPAPPPSLWRNWRFQALWIGSSTSLLGINAADFAYPVIILLMTRSPALAAVFGFVQMAA